MLTDEDKALWEAFTKTVKPLGTKSKLKGFGSRLIQPLGFRPKIKPVIPVVLDLHGFTLQEAYALFIRFLDYHSKNGTKKIVVITGKGKEGKGLLKAEFPKWLENGVIKEKIVDFKMPLLGGGGAFELVLKQRKN